MSKLDGYKKGDRVRVMFEGVVTDSGRNAGLRVVAEHDIVWVGAKTNRSHDHFKITRIEPAFKVGDEVLVLGHRNGNQSIVGFLKDGRAIVKYQAGDTSNVCAYDISCLAHA